MTTVPPPAARPSPDIAKPGASKKLLPAAAVVLALGTAAAWFVIRDGDTGTSGTSTSGPADDGGPSTTRDDAGSGASRGTGGKTDSAPPGAKGVGRLRPAEPPPELVKDPCTLEIEKVIDDLMKEQP